MDPAYDQPRDASGKGYAPDANKIAPGNICRTTTSGNVRPAGAETFGGKLRMSFYEAGQTVPELALGVIDRALKNFSGRLRSNSNVQRGIGGLKSGVLNPI